MEHPKVNMETLPVNMQALPIDKRGFPIPWFVAYVNGEPEFRAMDSKKFDCAIVEHRCWVCGNKLGIYHTFVAGPMCGINQTSSEPASHKECAIWSAINCPFLSNPKMVRRQDEVIDNVKLQQNTAGIAISRNPGVAMLWTSRDPQLFNAGNGFLFHIGEPDSVEWYAHGRKATRAEVMESVESGLPILEKMAKEDGPESIRQLERMVKRFMRHVPLEEPAIPVSL